MSDDDDRYVLRLLLEFSAEPIRERMESAGYRTGQYVREHDVDEVWALGSVGECAPLVATDSLDEAARFETFRDAGVYRNRVPKDEPVRPDGRPNRPLSAFFTEVLTVAKARERYGA